MHLPTTARFGLILASFTAFSALPLTAQQAPDTPFVDVIDVRVVNLEVVVEDSRGQRVTGLRPQDFRLRVNGDDVAIDFFSEVVDGTAVSRDTGSAVESLPRAAPGRPVGTSYLVFVDDFFTVKAERNRVLAGIAADASRLGREDRMAVVAFDGDRIELLTSWNDSPAEVQEVLAEAQQRPARGLQSGLLLRQAQSSGTLGVDVVRNLEDKVERIVLAVTATLRSFANPPGRKVMLLVSGGWPLSALRYATSSSTLLDNRGERQLQPIYQTANLLGYTLYPIDAPGMRSGGLGGGPDLVSQQVPARPRAASAQEEEVHDALRILAAETGGRALLDGAREAAFDRVIADTRTYYWLGFSPDWQSDGRSHDVQIEVLRPGLRVRSRKGYRDYSRSQEVSYMVESALLFGEMPGAQPLTVEVGTPGKSLRRTALPLKLSFPLDEVAVLPLQGRYVVQMELRIVAVDGKGHRSDVDLLPVRLDGTRPPVPGQMGSQEVTVNLRRGDHRLVVSLHDPVSGTIFSSTVELGG